MKYNYFLGLTIIACIYISYANVQKFRADASTNDLARAINEQISKAQNDNSSMADGENLASSGRNSRETAKTLDDNSVIKTIYDGMGNKKESRCFNNHPRVMCVILRSSADGKRFIQVYGQNGYVKELEEDMYDRVLNASADEIADLADIYITSAPATQTARSENTPATAMPAYPAKSGESQTSTQNMPIAPVKTEEAKKPEPATGVSETKSAPAVKNTQSKENENPPAANRPPGENE
ncbi:MAG TPA: hypothetical protein VK308_16985 [Pyrinomonadaceae bacterium]|nr:hypothetical protein [Pyrinomonadaceae bacterium]